MVLTGLGETDSLVRVLCKPLDVFVRAPEAITPHDQFIRIEWIVGDVQRSVAIHIVSVFLRRAVRAAQLHTTEVVTHFVLVLGRLVRIEHSAVLTDATANLRPPD